MRHLIIYFFLLISVNLFSQFTTMFNDTLKPFGSGAYSLDNVQKDDSFYYVTGIFAGALTNNQQQPIVLKIDNCGVLLKKKLIVDSINHYGEYFYNSTILDNNNLLQLVSKTDTLNRDLGTIIAINKHSLDTLWTKTYAHPDTLMAQTAQYVFSVLTAIKATPDEGYILTGNYNKDCVNGNLRSFLMKIDSVGNVEWRRVYGDVTYLFDIELTSYGGYAFLNKFGNNINKIVFTDSLGVIIRQQLINSGQGGLSKTSSLTTNDGNIFYGAHTYTFDINNHYYGLNIYKYNYSTNQVLWDKRYIPYSYIEFISLHPALGIEVMSNGDIISSGTAKRYGYDAFILKLNSNGDSLWCKSYDFNPDPYDCQLNDLIVTDDGGFMGVGFWSDQSGPGWTAWMFKTDANGVIGWDTSTPLSIQKLKVWPNPAKEFTTISISQALNQESEIIIYNSLGQIEKTLNLQKQQQELEVNVQGFAAGLYFFELRAAEGVLGVGKFVVE